MVFQFEHICLDQQPGGEKWDAAPLPLVRLKRCMERWQQGLHGRGWNSLFLNNHDLPRIVSCWGDDGRYRVESAKMLATMLYGMEGTPYIYQGEELGMTNIRLPIEAYGDIETRKQARRTGSALMRRGCIIPALKRGNDRVDLSRRDRSAEVSDTAL